jgi:hypothetical protein
VPRHTQYIISLGQLARLGENTAGNEGEQCTDWAKGSDKIISARKLDTQSSYYPPASRSIAIGRNRAIITNVCVVASVGEERLATYGHRGQTRAEAVTVHLDLQIQPISRPEWNVTHHNVQHIEQCAYLQQYHSAITPLVPSRKADYVPNIRNTRQVAQQPVKA